MTATYRTSATRMPGPFMPLHRVQLGDVEPVAPCDVGKAQWIRLADVFVVGPLMVAGGLALRSKSKLAGYALVGLGIGTVALNGANYVRFGRQFNLWV